MRHVWLDSIRPVPFPASENLVQPKDPVEGVTR